MDHDHRLDAPDEEALRSIEQLDDHSELTTIYRRAKHEWDGVEIVSREEREKQQREERLRISLSLRKWFLPIGLFIPLPIIVITLLLTLTSQYFSIQSLGILLLPILIGVGALVYATYRGFKYAYKIFYAHGVRAWPFIFIQIALLGMSLNGLFLLTEPLHTGEEWIDMLTVAGAVLITSIVYSLVLVLAWSSPRLGSAAKVGVAGLLALVALCGTAALYLF